MRIPTALAVALIAWMGVGVAAAQQDTRPDRGRLRIMTFNGEFLWDGRLPEEGNVDFPWKGSPDEADEHLAEIAQVIAAADPDIVNLVEVEGIDALNRLNDQFLPGRGYTAHLIQGLDTYTGQDVGILTRIGLRSIGRTDIYGESGSVRKRVSKNYVATLSVGDTLNMVVIGVHFLAFPLRLDRVDERQAQADAIRQVARAYADSGFAVVVLGDLNDYDGAVDSRDVNDHQPITTVLADLRELDPSDDSDDLVNVGRLLPQARRYTAHYDANQDGFVTVNELSAIDHVLLSGRLADLVESVDVDQGYDPLTVSDHFPVVVTLQLGAPAPVAGVQIQALLPNPEGNEREGEAVSVINLGAASASVAGWTLRDKTGRTWSLSGSIPAGQCRQFKRQGQAMVLRNGGDVVELVDDGNVVAHTVEYTETVQAEWIVIIPSDGQGCAA